MRSARSLDGRAMDEPEGVGEERTSAPSADEASWRRTTVRAGARGTRARGGGTPDPRRIDRGIGSRSTGGGQATGNAPQPTSHQPSERVRRHRASNSPSPITTRGETTPRHAARSALGPDEARGADTPSSREASRVKLKIGKNVETRVSRFSRASARVLSLSTQTAAPCTYFHRLKHSKQCDPRRSSRCYSRGDGRRTRT